MEEITRFFAIFYADNGLITSRYNHHLQATPDILVVIFICVGPQTNTPKIEIRIVVLGRIRTPLTSVAYNNRMEDLMAPKEWC